MAKLYVKSMGAWGHKGELQRTSLLADEMIYPVSAAYMHDSCYEVVCINILIT